MKTTLFIAVFALLGLASCKKATDDAPNTDIQVIPASAVPAAVVTALNTSFSGATEVEWHKSSSDFTAQFNHSSARHQSTFDDRGNSRSHSVICTSAPVPAAVLTAFRQSFANDNVYEWKLTNEGTWKAHFMRGTVKWEATFTAAGVLIKTEHD